MHSRRWGGRVASALAAAALATGTSAEPTDCLVCQKMVRAISSATGCEGNPCELDGDLMRLDRCHERAEGVASNLRAAGAALEPTKRRGDYKLNRACDDLRKLPSHVLCVRHGVCLSRCDVRAPPAPRERRARHHARSVLTAREVQVCERIIGFWHANGCAGSPCTDVAVGRAQNLARRLEPRAPAAARADRPRPNRPPAPPRAEIVTRLLGRADRHAARRAARRRRH